MTTKLVKWASNDGQIIKSGLSDGYGGKAITTAAHLDYDRHGFEGYPGNVGLVTYARNANVPGLSGFAVKWQSFHPNLSPLLGESATPPSAKPERELIADAEASDVVCIDFNIEEDKDNEFSRIEVEIESLLLGNDKAGACIVLNDESFSSDSRKGKYEAHSNLIRSPSDRDIEIAEFVALDGEKPMFGTIKILDLLVGRELFRFNVDLIYLSTYGLSYHRHDCSDIFYNDGKPLNFIRVMGTLGNITHAKIAVYGIRPPRG